VKQEGELLRQLALDLHKHGVKASGAQMSDRTFESKQNELAFQLMIFLSVKLS
jgi:hypothetical protein